MLQTEQYSTYEIEIISLINQNKNSLELLKDNISFDEIYLEQTLNSLESKNLIVYDKLKKCYSFDKPLKDDKVIFTGNLLLPVTIIKKKDKQYITRGEWYEVPLDFDFRRIIWNVSLPNNKKTTLIDLVKESLIKEKKTKIKQLEEYKNLVGKLVPYNKFIKLRLNAIGEELTDVTIIFLIEIGEVNSDIKIDFREFTLKSVIKTSDLLRELTASNEERNFENIQLNRIFNFSDFIFLNNSFPTKLTYKSLEYVQITGIKNKLELTHYSLDSNGNQKRIGIDEFTDSNEGLNYLKEIIDTLPKEILHRSNILIEN